MLAALDNLRAGRSELPGAGFSYIGRGFNLFVVMLVNLKRPPEAHEDPHRRTKLGFGLAAAVLLELGAIAVYGFVNPAAPMPATPAIPVSGNTEQVGWLLYTSYLIPFEIATMLLLVAMIGAIVLAKREL